MRAVIKAEWKGMQTITESRIPPSVQTPVVELKGSEVQAQDKAMGFPSGSAVMFSKGHGGRIYRAYPRKDNGWLLEALPPGTWAPATDRILSPGTPAGAGPVAWASSQTGLTYLAKLRRQGKGSAGRVIVRGSRAAGPWLGLDDGWILGQARMGLDMGRLGAGSGRAAVSPCAGWAIGKGGRSPTIARVGTKTYAYPTQTEP